MHLFTLMHLALPCLILSSLSEEYENGTVVSLTRYVFLFLPHADEPFQPNLFPLAHTYHLHIRLRSTSTSSTVSVNVR